MLETIVDLKDLPPDPSLLYLRYGLEEALMLLRALR